jgi:hypothetical protein
MEVSLIVANVDLSMDTESIKAAMDTAQVFCDEAWTHARRVLIEVFLLPPSHIMEMRDGWTRSLLVGGSVVYRQRPEHLHDTLVVFADWLFHADYPHHHGYIE